MNGREVVADASAIALGFSFQTQLDDKRILTSQTHMPLDATPKHINDVLDKLATAADRLEARYTRRKLVVVLKQNEKNLAMLLEDRGRIDAKKQADWTAQGRKGDVKLNASEQAQRDGTATNEKRYRQAIGEIKVEIEDCDELLKGLDPGK